MFSDLTFFRGTAPFIMLEDANIEKAAQVAIKSRFIDTGQSCKALKRFTVLVSVVAAFVERMELLIQELEIRNL
jgi:succinate-semialdehyde dehydrogenase/glutarate-semialdehyde dehydrogenase